MHEGRPLRSRTGAAKTCDHCCLVYVCFFPQYHDVFIPRYLDKQKSSTSISWCLCDYHLTFLDSISMTSGKPILEYLSMLPSISKRSRSKRRWKFPRWKRKGLSKKHSLLLVPQDLLVFLALNKRKMEVTKKTGVEYPGNSHISQSNHHSIESNETLRLGDLAKEYVSPMNSEPRFKQNLENIFLPHGSSASHMLFQEKDCQWLAQTSIAWHGMSCKCLLTQVFVVRFFHCAGL